MATRNDIISAIQAADHRLAVLSPAITAAPDRPLREGTWTIRDALCHIAARADGVTVAFTFIETNSAAEGAPAALEIDEVNRRQIDERQGRDVASLIDEAAAGHKAALMRLATLDDGVLNQVVQLPFLNSPSTIGDLILLAGPGHEQAHLDTIAEVVPPAPGR